MKILKKIYCIISLMLISVILVLTPKSNAKFIFTNFGIAWENYFTEFTQLKDVFYITDDSFDKNGKYSQDELWGPKNVDVSSLFGNGSDSEIKLTNGIYTYGGGDGFNSDTPNWDDGFFGIGGKRVELSRNDISTIFSDYLVERLKGIEINFVNQSSEDVIVTFQIHYYGPKIKDDTSTLFTFELYNTIEHPDVIDDPTGKLETITYIDQETNEEKTRQGNIAVQGEVLVNKTKDQYTPGNLGSEDDPRYYADIPSVRNSGANQAEIYVNEYRDFYYPFKIDINPYQMLYNSGYTDLALYHQYTMDGTAYNTPYTTGDAGQGTTVVYGYPSRDNTSNKSAIELMPDVDINDFILKPSEAGSFNLSLFYGSKGTKDSGTGSFVTALCLTVQTLSKAQEDYLATLQKNGKTV